MNGTVAKYGRDNIDTDVIVPGQYLKIHDYDELARHAMEGLDPGFAAKKADFVLAGKNFGCGSSREHAPIALSRSGVKAVLALSFARIFYRNCVDGAFLLPVEIGPEAYAGIGDGERISLDTSAGTVSVEGTGASYPIEPFPDIIEKIICAGGLFRFREQDAL